MSAEHIYERANTAAVQVDPLILASALDHIAKTAAKSRSQTRRIRWIEQRAVLALEGREYREIDVDLPKDAGNTAEKMKRKADHCRRMNQRLIYAADALLVHLDRIGMTREEQPLMDALREAIEMTESSGAAEGPAA